MTRHYFFSSDSRFHEMTMINHIIVSQLIIKVGVFSHVPVGTYLVFLHFNGLEQRLCVCPDDWQLWLVQPVLKIQQFVVLEISGQSVPYHVFDDSINLLGRFLNHSDLFFVLDGFLSHLIFDFIEGLLSQFFITVFLDYSLPIVPGLLSLQLGQGS